MERFLSAVCEALEKYMFDFDPKTHDDIVSVAYNVVNSKAGIKIISKLKQFIRDSSLKFIPFQINIKT